MVRQRPARKKALRGSRLEKLLRTSLLVRRIPVELSIGQVRTTLPPCDETTSRQLAITSAVSCCRPHPLQRV